METTFIHDLSRGLNCRCIKCGQGKLFGKWLKVVDHCDQCGEEYHHHRADDLPAYIVILILGHTMVSLALGLEGAFAPPFWVHVAVTIPVTIGLALGLLQPVKGGVVAIQWRMGMHGFSKSKNTASKEN
jgi:uncharacterized protein (DUF983 family)